VDINNLVSLETGFPVSLLDVSTFSRDEPDGDPENGRLILRYGLQGESYVFNSGGQEIEVEGLPCACSEGGPIGNPCKDSMKGKIRPETTDVVGIVYASTEVVNPEKMEAILEGFGGLLIAHAGASCVGFAVLGQARRETSIGAGSTI
jgi:DNA/RNA-binding domain of Phe-tRNA-synthetase-like protein